MWMSFSLALSVLFAIALIIIWPTLHLIPWNVQYLHKVLSQNLLQLNKIKCISIKFLGEFKFEKLVFN